MPVEFLTSGQRADRGRYVGEPGAADLARCLHLDDADLQRLAGKRGGASRLGFALQLTTVRFLGRLPDENMEVPASVLDFLRRQLDPGSTEDLREYWGNGRASGIWRRFTGFTITGKSPFPQWDSGCPDGCMLSAGRARTSCWFCLKERSRGCSFIKFFCPEPADWSVLWPVDSEEIPPCT